MHDKGTIGKIKRVGLRELWRKEDKDFTTWLEKNIDYLNDVLDFDIIIDSKEKDVGPFKVDLYGEDNNGRKVIIENQLEKTDHDHLGKVLTYLVNLDAKTAIWLTSNPVEEHAKVIDWINEITPDDISFYLIKVEAIKIGEQPLAAPLFTIIKGPSSESKATGDAKKKYARRHLEREKFWTQLLDKSNKKMKLFTNVSPSTDSWIAAGAGKSGIVYEYTILRNSGGVEVYFSRGKGYESLNKDRFDALFKKKGEIEKEFGGPLNWERLDNRSASRISLKFEMGGWEDKEKWDELQDKMVDAMIRLEKAFKKHIHQLK